MQSGGLSEDILLLREQRFPFIADGYFLLNKAYKEWRIPNGHNTEHPKIAALQCVTIARYQPFFPLVIPVPEENLALAKPNEIFAFSYAMGILEIQFEPDTPEKVDFWLRVLDVISSTSAQTLNAYSTDKSFQINNSFEHYHQQAQAIHKDDKPAINALICIFELMSKKGRTLGFSHH